MTPNWQSGPSSPGLGSRSHTRCLPGDVDINCLSSSPFETGYERQSCSSRGGNPDIDVNAVLPRTLISST